MLTDPRGTIAHHKTPKRRDQNSENRVVTEQGLCCDDLNIIVWPPSNDSRPIKQSSRENEKLEQKLSICNVKGHS